MQRRCDARETQRRQCRVCHRRWHGTPVGLSQATIDGGRDTLLRALGLVTLLLAVSAEWGVSFCWAESDTPSPNARAILKRGTIEVAGTVGYWQAWLFPTEEHSTNHSAVFIMPKIGMVVTDEVQAGVLTGNLEVLAEPFFAQFTHPFAAEAAGGSLVIKYNLLSFGRWMPFWDAGAGML